MQIINQITAAIESVEGVRLLNVDPGKEAIAAGKDVNYEGASGPLAFDASGTPAGSYSIQQAKDGKWENVKFYPASAFE